MIMLLIRRNVSIVLLIGVILSLSACHTAYTVTGEIEEGNMIVWYSPRVSEYYNSHVDISLSYFDYGDEYTPVYFDSDEEFQNALEQRLLTDKCPDLIIAYGEELPPKLLAGDSIADLDIFWDYQDSIHFDDNDDVLLETGNLQRTDINPAMLDMCRIGSKLTAMPISLSIWDYYINGIENDKKYGFDFTNSNLTIDEYTSQISELYKHSGLRNKLYTFQEIPSLEQTFDKFIDYSERTTRMSEDITYQYYCSYTLVYKKYHNLLNQIEELTKNGDDDRKLLNAFLEDNPMDYIYTPSTPMETRFFTSESYTSGTSTSEYIKKYYKPSEIYAFPPSDYGNCIYVSPSDCMVASIPANAKHPYKAFSYLQVFYSTAYILTGSDNDSNHIFSLSIIDKTIDNLDISDELKTEIYDRVIQSKYIWTWSDRNINEWFQNFMYNSDGSFRSDLPTREEWDEVKHKVELYLNE